MLPCAIYACRQISHRVLDKVATLSNNGPRKCLNYRSAAEVLRARKIRCASDWYFGNWFALRRGRVVLETVAAILPKIGLSQDSKRRKGIEKRIRGHRLMSDVSQR